MGKPIFQKKQEWKILENQYYWQSTYVLIKRLSPGHLINVKA